ncbi:MAG: CDP-alcohol phosphatidyltransferase family protein [Eggerthellaceae bacterium]|nr:CDP-alcohol phosphatidyltransferase family protein [Eggerthellaceae bacterium]
MAPLFLALLLNGHDMVAAILFGVAAATDFVDGQIARRTHSVSKLGQLLDPTVDRVLMVCAVVGTLMVGRLPVWIVVLVLVRDGVMILGGMHLLKNYQLRVPVIYAGKFATTFLFFGLFGLLLNMPIIQGLGWTTIEWLPGFNTNPCSWGIWFVYAGLLLGLFTTAYYIRKAVEGVRAYKESDAR